MNTNPPFDDTDGAFAILEFTGDNLEPEHLIPLIHASGARFRRKGDAIASKAKGITLATRTGYCRLSTIDRALPPTGDAHLLFIINAIIDNLDDIKRVVSDSSLTWHTIFFDGFENGTHFSDLSRDLRQRTAELGITLKQKNPDKFTTVLDPAWTARER